MGKNRIMLIMSIIFDLATLQVDYTTAFVHADIDKPPNWDTIWNWEGKKSGVYIEIKFGHLF
jgi:Tol biopolymer transport system component